ncbi:DnaJ domain-containing protein [bacterium]|nr:DnaJ domain-containing protein [bacterium]
MEQYKDVMVSTAVKNFYKILQVDPSAEPAIIKAAYRTLMLQLKKHPDYGGNTDEAKDINMAYQVLKDPIERKEYDKNNYFFLQQNISSDSLRKYYMRCYFCGAINRIDFSSTKSKLKSIVCGKCRSPFFSDKLDENSIGRRKRKFERYKCVFPIKIQLKFSGVFYPGMCKDFSSNAMLFSSSIELSKDQIIKVVFTKDKEFQTIAKVIRKKMITHPPDKSFEYAVLFIEARYGKPN